VEESSAVRIETVKGSHSCCRWTSGHMHSQLETTSVMSYSAQT